jgi:cell division cycle 14
MSSSGGLRHAVEIIPRTLFWLPAVDKEVPINLPSSEYDVFSIDDEFVYERFFADFGPLHLGSTVRFCRMVEDKLEKVKDTNRVVVLKCGHHKHLRTNSALLIGIFCIVALHKTADEAYLPFVGKSSHFIPYRDAAFGLCTYNLTVIDTLRGVEKSVANGFFQYSCFNVEEHERLQQIEHGDVNWIQPGKLLAFSGPFDERRQIGPDRHTFSVDDYVPLFKKLGVTCVIRFNKKCYDRRRLLQKGISHVDLFYEDGGNPTDAIMYKFIEICEREKGAVAVHCKAGLGRTGTNIGAYMMKHYKYTADEFIGWCRICRPGSVVGPQQQFLADKQPVLWKAGDMANRKKSGATNGQESFKAQSSMSAGAPILLCC